MKYNRLIAMAAGILICGTSLAQTLSLDGEWQLSYWKQPSEAITDPSMIAGAPIIKASVPGNVEIDLQAAGLIEDPMTGSNVNRLREWEDTQYCYTRTFTAPVLDKGDRYQLWFGGIDCLADIWLNGEHIGKAEDMLIEHEFDVTDAIRPGEDNTLQIVLRSMVMEGQKDLLGALSIRLTPAPESIRHRKAPHMFGWDIMPRLVSAGIWRSVELRAVKPTRIRDVYYIVNKIDREACTAEVYVDLQLAMPFSGFDHNKAVFTFSLDGKEVVRESEVIKECAMRHCIRIDDAKLWWPRGYGDPTLYDVKVEIVDEAGNTLASKSERLGLRKVRLERSEINLKPETPGKFQFYVNDVPIFVRGTNWVPLDALHSRDKSFYDEAVACAADLNCNMMRCWGGNVYEDHRFYDLCDENGIMIWQDFTMGCTFYPQDTEFAETLYDEVKKVVCKLRNHCCIAIWAGNNEDDQSLMWSFTGYRIDPNRDRVSRQVIPSVIYEYDPTRPYLASSPYYSEETYLHGGDDKYLPEAHLWGPRGYYKAPFYTDAECQFVSEIGYHGCPNRESLEKMMTPGNVYPWAKGTHEWNDEWLTKAVREFEAVGSNHVRNNLMINQVNLLFGETPDDLDRFIYASQTVQAEAMKYFIEMWRGQKFDDKTGIIWWNLRDGWPIISDAIMDYYFSKKIAYSFIKNVQRNICCLINDPVNGRYPLIAVNDTMDEQTGTVKVTDVETGKTLYKGKFTIPVNSATRVADIPEQDGQGVLKIEYTTSEGSFTNHYLYGKAPFSLDSYRSWMDRVYP